MTRINSKTTKTYDEVSSSDELIVGPSVGDDYNITLGELIKLVINGNVTAGTALASALMKLDGDKKIEGVGGIKMFSEYTPSDNQDVATKKYVDNGVLNSDNPILIHREVWSYDVFTSGASKTLLTLAAGDLVLGIYVYIKTAFTDSGTDIIDIGKTGDADYFEADIDASSIGMNNCNDATFPYRAGAEDITITYTGENDNADAGVVEVFVHYVKF